MARKTIAFYPPTPISTGNGKKLRVEIGPYHVACSVSENDQPIAFEFFELDNDINDWSDVFFELKTNSLLLDKNFGPVDICYNFKEALLIPVEKLSSAAAEDYLSLIHGESNRHDTKHDKLLFDQGIVNVYRIKKTINDQAVRHFHLYQVQHIYSDILNKLSTRNNGSGIELILQVYPQSIIAVLLIDQKLQFIQTFLYENTEDACFYLLSLLKEYGINTNDVQLDMCGFIAPHGDLHRRIQQLFSRRSFHNIPEAALLPGMMEEYHPHYFTPFFNVES